MGRFRLYTFTTEGEFTLLAYHWFATRREAESARAGCAEASPVRAVAVPRDKRGLAEFLTRYMDR